MRSWTPRRPSARLEQRLFPSPATAGGPAETPPYGALAWLTPATCALLLCFAAWLLHQGARPPGQPGVNLLALAPAGAAPSPTRSLLAAALPAPTLPQMNTLSAAGIDWAKTGLANSTTGLFAAWKTNTQKL